MTLQEVFGRQGMVIERITWLTFSRYLMNVFENMQLKKRAREDILFCQYLTLKMKCSRLMFHAHSIYRL